MTENDRVAAALAHYASIGHARSVPGDTVPADYPATVEAVLGVALPADYRRFLAAHPCTGGPDAVVISPFIGSDNRGGASLLEFRGFATGRTDLAALNQTSGDFQIPGMLIIADDAFGNWFYLDLRTSEVWFSDRITATLGARKGLALVGTDFADFLLRMEVDHEGDVIPGPAQRTLWQRLTGWIAP